jgi:metal-responsive CopG/Arc/MetJ family transcriptional regulator
MGFEENTSMQDQLTIRLPADLSQALKAASRRMQRKSSEIVRLALREYLVASPGSKARPADRVRSLIGSLESGTSDLGEKHRAYIIESLRRGR